MRVLYFLLLLLALLHAATIYGDVYNADDFENAKDVIVRISGAASAQFVAKEGNYSVELPAGSYFIQAFYYENNSLEYYSYARLNITNETDSMHFDIVLFRPEMLELLYEIYDEVPLYERNRESQAASAPSLQGDNYFYLIVLVLLFLLLATRPLSHLFKSKKKPVSAPGEEEVLGDARQDFALDEDGKMVVALLEANEGRMLQRELRRQLGFSETKMSLLLDELEFSKIIKRIKRGRGNIIKLFKRDQNG